MLESVNHRVHKRSLGTDASRFTDSLAPNRVVRGRCHDLEEFVGGLRLVPKPPISISSTAIRAAPFRSTRGFLCPAPSKNWTTGVELLDMSISNAEIMRKEKWVKEKAAVSGISMRSSEV